MTKKLHWKRKRSGIWGLSTAKRYVNWFPGYHVPGNQIRRGASVKMKNAELPSQTEQYDNYLPKHDLMKPCDEWANKWTMVHNCSNVFNEATPSLQTFIYRPLDFLMVRVIRKKNKGARFSADAFQHQDWKEDTRETPTHSIPFLQRVSPGCAKNSVLAQDNIPLDNVRPFQAQQHKLNDSMVRKKVPFLSSITPVTTDKAIVSSGHGRKHRFLMLMAM